MLEVRRSDLVLPNHRQNHPPLGRISEALGLLLTVQPIYLVSSNVLTRPLRESYTARRALHEHAAGIPILLFTMDLASPGFSSKYWQTFYFISCSTRGFFTSEDTAVFGSS